MSSLEELLERRKELLIEHPELLETQIKIDTTLAHVKDPIERCQILTLLMEQSYYNLNAKLNELKEYVIQTGILKQINDEVLKLSEILRSEEGNNNTNKP